MIQKIERYDCSRDSTAGDYIADPNAAHRPRDRNYRSIEDGSARDLNSDWVFVGIIYAPNGLLPKTCESKVSNDCLLNRSRRLTWALVENLQRIAALFREDGGDWERW